MNDEYYRTKLVEIITDKPATIQAFVAQEAIEHSSITNFFNDVSQHGCISGMVGSLIYYSQTHQFFDVYYDEIEELRIEFEENTGTQFTLNHDLKNTLSWFAFEYTAYKIANKLNIF